MSRRDDGGGLIGLDWGTSSLRAYLFGAGGEVREARAQPWGLRQLPAGGFDAALSQITAGWPALPQLACGMVGSRSGWREVPYVDLPADTAGLGAATLCVQAANGSTVHIVPGLRNTIRPDVMRGEETQLIGALALQPALARGSTWLLPGTHSKWVSVRDGVVIDFATMMSGELFAVLRAHSILGAGLDQASDTHDAEAFARGVRSARDSGAAGALSWLFSTRALMLDGALAPASVPDYLSGLLLGEELRATVAGQRFDLSAPIQLIGEAALCDRYRAAAAHFDLSLEPPIADATAHGLWQVAMRAGLLSRERSFLKDSTAC